MAAGSCPLCGAAMDPGVTVCGNCGAKIPAPEPGPAPAPVPAPAPAAPPEPKPAPPAEEVLLEQLEDLSVRVAEEGIVEDLGALEAAGDAEVEAVDRTIGELEAIHEEVKVVEARLQAEEADLSEFVRRVESRVTAQAHAPAPPPKRSAAGTALLATGGLAAASGLFLLPGALLVGAFTLLAGVAVFAIGAAVRFRRPPRQ